MAAGDPCHYCGTTTAELRPYGPGGAPICFACMKAVPEREAAAKGAYLSLIDANQAMSGGPVTIGTEEGPHPFVFPGEAPDGGR